MSVYGCVGSCCCHRRRASGVSRITMKTGTKQTARSYTWLPWQVWLWKKMCCFSRRPSRLWGWTARASLQAFLWQASSTFYSPEDPHVSLHCFGNLRRKYETEIQQWRRRRNQRVSGKTQLLWWFWPQGHWVTTPSKWNKRSFTSLQNEHLWNLLVNYEYPWFYFLFKRTMHLQSTVEPPGKQAWLWMLLRRIYLNLK